MPETPSWGAVLRATRPLATGELFFTLPNYDRSAMGTFFYLAELRSTVLLREISPWDVSLHNFSVPRQFCCRKFRSGMFHCTTFLLRDNFAAGNFAVQWEVFFLLS